MYNENNVKEIEKDGFHTTVRMEDGQLKSTFEIIDTSRSIDSLTEVEKDYLGIIKGDIFESSVSLFDKAIVMSDYSDHDVFGSYQMVVDYVAEHGLEQAPVFFVVGCDYPFADQHIGTLCKHGFYTADQLVYLENNFVLVRTATLEDYRKLNKRMFFNRTLINRVTQGDLEMAKFWMQEFKKSLDAGFKKEPYKEKMAEVEATIANEELVLKSATSNEEKQMIATNIATMKLFLGELLPEFLAEKEGE